MPSTDKEESAIPPNPTTNISPTTNEAEPSTLIEPTSNVPKLSISDTEPSTLFTDASTNKVEPSTLVAEPSMFETESSTFEAEHSTYEVEPSTSEIKTEYIPDYNYIYELLELLRSTFQEKLKQYFVYNREEKEEVQPITTFPWFVGFESSSDLNGFNFIDANGDFSNWVPYYKGQIKGYSNSNGFIYSKAYDPVRREYLNPDNWMILPPFSLPTDATGFNISWYEKGENTESFAEVYYVYISTTGRNTNDFTDEMLCSTTTRNWVKKSVDLSNYSGKTINIAFRHYHQLRRWWLYIDDIRVEGPVQPITTFPRITTFPWIANFEKNKSLVGFSFIDNDGDGHNWELSLNNNGHDSKGSMLSYTYDSVKNLQLNPDNWMILPPITLPTNAKTFEISWYDYCHCEDNSEIKYIKYIVYVSTKSSSIEDFTTPLFYGNATNNWEMKSVDLSSYAGKTINISFQHNDTSEKNVLQIDDIRVEGVIINSVNFIIDEIKTQIKEQIETGDIETIKDNFIAEVNNSINNLFKIGLSSTQNIDVNISNIDNLNSSVYLLNQTIYNEVQDNQNLYQVFNLSIHDEISALLSLSIIKDIDEMIQRLTNLQILFDECYKLIRILPSVSNYFKTEDEENIGLRLLSMNKNERTIKLNIKAAQMTGSLTCKLDDTFKNDMTLIANPENIEAFILISNKDYNIVLNSAILLKVGNGITNKCNDPHTEKIYKSINYKGISILKPEPAKKRFFYTITFEISPKFEIPIFFYLLIKVKMSIKKINLRFLDIQEEVATYCVYENLENYTNIENAIFNCYGYSDNINAENENNKITIVNFTSDFVEFPENIWTTNKPENKTEGANLRLRSKKSGLSGGGIAGIIIACVVCLAAIIAMIIIGKKKFPKYNTIQESQSQNNLKIYDD